MHAMESSFVLTSISPIRGISLPRPVSTHDCKNESISSCSCRRSFALRLSSMPGSSMPLAKSFTISPMAERIFWHSVPLMIFSGAIACGYRFFDTIMRQNTALPSRLDGLVCFCLAGFGKRGGALPSSRTAAGTCFFTLDDELATAAEHFSIDNYAADFRCFFHRLDSRGEIAGKVDQLLYVLFALH